MKVVSFLTSLVLVGVGTWARVHYRSIQSEIHGGGQLEYGTLDQYFYDDGNALTSGSCSPSANQKCKTNYVPKQTVSSGVQENPYLD